MSNQFNIPPTSFDAIVEMIKNRKVFSGAPRTGGKGRQFPYGYFFSIGREGGITFDQNNIVVGRLGPETARTYAASAMSHRIDYVVFSYDTPIAWHFMANTTDDTGEEIDWVITTDVLSRTTSIHQQMVQRALGQI